MAKVAEVNPSVACQAALKVLTLVRRRLVYAFAAILAAREFHHFVAGGGVPGGVAAGGVDVAGGVVAAGGVVEVSVPPPLNQSVPQAMTIRTAIAAAIVNHRRLS